MTDDARVPAQEQAGGSGFSAPNSARIWNYWLGGQDNTAVDQAVGEQVLQAFPGIAQVARAQRAFLDRAIGYLAGEARIRQFLDVGSGLPTAGNTHEVAQRIAPESRVVYADNDPAVLDYARSLLTSTPEGATEYVAGDLRGPGQIRQAAARILDLTQPVALVLLGVLGHVGSDDEAKSVVHGLLDSLPAGSYLVIADGTDTDEAGNEAQRRYNDRSPLPYHLRSPARIAGFFEGLELVEPGVVSCSRWRPGPAGHDDNGEVATFCGVARKR